MWIPTSRASVPAVTARPWPVTPTPHPGLNPDATLHNNNPPQHHSSQGGLLLYININSIGLFSSSSSDVAEGLYWFVQTHYRKYKSLNSASNFPIIVMSLASFPGNEGREDGVYQQVELSDETDGFQLCQEIETVSVHIHISCHGVTARQ